MRGLAWGNGVGSDVGNIGGGTPGGLGKVEEGHHPRPHSRRRPDLNRGYAAGSALTDDSVYWPLVDHLDASTGEALPVIQHWPVRIPIHGGPGTSPRIIHPSFEPAQSCIGYPVPIAAYEAVRLVL